VTTALLVASLVAAAAFSAVVWHRSRSLAFAAVALAVLGHYHLDAIATVARGSLFISRTYPDLPLAAGVAARVGVLATVVSALLAVGYVAVRSRGAARPLGAERTTVRLWVGAALLVPLAVAVRRVADAGLGDLLVANRQAVLSSDLLGMVTFHAVPAAAALACYGAVTSRGWRRAAWAVLFAVYLGLALVSGSRSAFLLNVVAPAAAFLAARGLRRLPPVLSWRATSKIVGAGALVAVLAVGLLASALYRDVTRGDQDPEGAFASPDLTQFDAAAHLMARDLGPTATYPAAAVVAVPRALWPDKPLSGNAALSQALFAERYEETRAEVTAGLLGEAWLNARWFGAVVAAGLLLALVLLAERLLVTPGVATMLGWVVLFRGLNLVRSDLLNTLVPLAFAVLLFWVAARPAVRISSARARVPALVGGAG
jgi:hypothetical protein